MRMKVFNNNNNINNNKEDDTTITTTTSSRIQLPKGRILVRINNEIYDLTNFVDRHPIPTDVFTPLVGKDATLDFLAAHDVESKPWKVLKAYKYRGPNQHSSLTVDEIDSIIPPLQPEDQDVLELYHKFKQDGLYDWTWKDYFMEEISGVLLLLIGFYIVMFGATGKETPFYWFGFLVAMIGMGRCQSHVHNLMHSDRSYEYQRWYGLVTAGWDMYTGLTYHRLHHVFTNITELDGAVESAPFLWHESQVNKDDAEKDDSSLPTLPLWVRGILCPLVYYFGSWTLSQPIGISGLTPSWFKLYLDENLVAPARRPGVLVGLFCIARTYFLCSHMGIWHYWLIHTMALAISFGTTTGQHFDDVVEDVKDVHSVMHDQSFLRHHLSTSIEYINVPWLLQKTMIAQSGGMLHCLHHLFPGLPPARLSQIKPYVFALCKKHNIEYREVPFWTAVWQGIWANYNRALEIEASLEEQNRRKKQEEELSEANNKKPDAKKNVKAAKAA